MPTLKHLVSTKDLDRGFIESFIHQALNLDFEPFTSPKILGTLFFEPSTRTRLSFESAMLRLNGKCLGFSDDQSTSIKKGETLGDTISTIAGYVEAIVIRHPIEGSAKLAAEIANDIPVINAGDGSSQHPTQSCADLLTLANQFGLEHFDNLKIGYIGDLKYGRTVHSLVDVLSHFNAEHFFIAPDPSLQIEEDHLGYTKKYHFVEETEDIIDHLDVLYVTRLQKERYPDPMEYERIMKKYQITTDSLREVKDDFIIMHPLPRNQEIHTDVDKTPYARYFQQAHIGVLARMIILHNLINRGGFKW